MRLSSIPLLLLVAVVVASATVAAFVASSLLLVAAAASSTACYCSYIYCRYTTASTFSKKKKGVRASSSLFLWTPNSSKMLVDRD